MRLKVLDDLLKPMKVADCTTPYQEPEKCLGLYYRAEVGEWQSVNGDIIHRQRMRPLKRLSCPGCGVCWHLLECFEEQAGPYMESTAFTDWVRDGHVYRLDYINITEDWESGVVDGYDAGFVHVPCGSKHEETTHQCFLPYKHKGTHKRGMIKWD